MVDWVGLGVRVGVGVGVGWGQLCRGGGGVRWGHSVKSFASIDSRLHTQMCTYKLLRSEHRAVRDEGLT